MKETKEPIEVIPQAISELGASCSTLEQISVYCESLWEREATDENMNVLKQYSNKAVANIEQHFSVVSGHLSLARRQMEQKITSLENRTIGGRLVKMLDEMTEARRDLTEQVRHEPRKVDPLMVNFDDDPSVFPLKPHLVRSFRTELGKPIITATSTEETPVIRKQEVETTTVKTPVLSPPTFLSPSVEPAAYPIPYKVPKPLADLEPPPSLPPPMAGADLSSLPPPQMLQSPLLDLALPPELSAPPVLPPPIIPSPNIPPPPLNF